MVDMEPLKEMRRLQIQVTHCHKFGLFVVLYYVEAFLVPAEGFRGGIVAVSEEFMLET